MYTRYRAWGFNPKTLRSTIEKRFPEQLVSLKVSCTRHQSSLQNIDGRTLWLRGSEENRHRGRWKTRGACDGCFEQAGHYCSKNKSVASDLSNFVVASETNNSQRFNWEATKNPSLVEGCYAIKCRRQDRQGDSGCHGRIGWLLRQTKYCGHACHSVGSSTRTYCNCWSYWNFYITDCC